MLRRHAGVLCGSAMQECLAGPRCLKKPPSKTQGISSYSMSFVGFWSSMRPKTQWNPKICKMQVDFIQKIVFWSDPRKKNPIGDKAAKVSHRVSRKIPLRSPEATIYRLRGRLRITENIRKKQSKNRRNVEIPRFFSWWTIGESNPDQRLRRALLYPLS